MDNQKDYSEFKKFKLSPYGLDISLYLPDQTAEIGASVLPEVVYEENGFKWQVSIGENFSIVINDRGNNVHFIRDKIAELKSLSMFEYKFLINTPELVLYERKLRPNYNFSEKYKHSYTSYHVIGIKKIDDYYYSFESIDEGTQLNYIQLITQSIQSIEIL